MTTYLNVGVSQIQTWLDRSPDLRGRRGASSMLGVHTSARRWQGFEGTSWNAEAGEVSGLVSLVVDTGVVAVRDVAQAALRRLREELPAATLVASWATGDTYVSAYPLMQAMLDEGRGLQLPPPTNENVLARRCARCGLDPVVDTVPRVGSVKDGRTGSEAAWEVCQDCLKRYAAAGDTRTSAEQLDPVLGRLKEARVAPDLETLARIGHDDPRDIPTRVAVLYADGNAVGAFIKTIVDRELDKSVIARMIDEANLEAFAIAAAEARWPAGKDEVLHYGVVPHLVAGDDVLVSLSAPAAWPFAVSYLRSFGELLQQRAAEAYGDALRGAELPSVSGALVFHHRSYPLPGVISRAADLLAAVKGTTPAGAFLASLDLMTDSGGAVVDPRPLRWVEDQLAGRLAEVAAWPVSTRKTLLAILGDKRLPRAQRRSSVMERLEKAGHGPDPDLVDDLPWLLPMATDLYDSRGARDD